MWNILFKKKEYAVLPNAQESKEKKTPEPEKDEKTAEEKAPEAKTVSDAETVSVEQAETTVTKPEAETTVESEKAPETESEKEVETEQEPEAEKELKAEENTVADNKPIADEKLIEEMKHNLEEAAKQEEPAEESPEPVSKGKRALRIILAILAGLLFTIGVGIQVGIRWVEHTWPHLTIDQLMYQMGTESEGVDPAIVKSGVIWIGSGLLAAVLVFLIGAFLIKRKSTKKKRIIYNTTAIVLGLAISAHGLYGAYINLAIGEYFAQATTPSTFVDEKYVDPSTVAITAPEEKRNLILIFMESMETTYSDQENGGGFETNYIPELTELAQANEDFSGSATELNGGIPLTYSTWTMAGLYTQQSGLPLKLPFNGLAMDTQESFFPQVTALGDILENDGYAQYYQCGSDAAFAGRDLFFKDHGDYTIYDLYTARETGEIPEDYFVFWGYEDKILFETAKTHITEAAASGEPFNYTLLTVDTHFEDGYICSDCGTTHSEKYGNVISCSSKKVSEFVGWISEQDFYEDTTVVIVGDHLTMDSDFCNPVSEEYTRKTYVNFINAPITPEDPTRERLYCTEDIYPTILASLGYDIAGDRLALGTNLFSSTDTLVEEYGVDTVNQELQKRSVLLEELADSLDKEAGRAIEENVQLNDPFVVIELIANDKEAGQMILKASDVTYSGGVNGARIHLWTTEDQSDLQIAGGVRDDSGNFFFTFDNNVFANPDGFYTCQVIVYGNDGSEAETVTTVFSFNEDGSIKFH